MNSLVIVLFLSGMVAMIMLRTLHKDIARYNQIDNSVSILSRRVILFQRYITLIQTVRAVSVISMKSGKLNSNIVLYLHSCVSDIDCKARVLGGF